VAPTPFVGRQDELELLGLALERARAGQGQVVAVVGEPGVGKTRLLGEVAERCGTEGWLVLVAETAAGGELTSYRVAGQLLRACFGLDEHPEPRAAAGAVAAAVGDALRPALPALLTVLDLPVEDPGWLALDPSVRRDRALESVGTLLLAESERRPVLVACDGMQWIDPESQAVLDRLVARLAPARILLLATHRPEYSPPWGGTSYFNSVGLGPLGGEAARRLLGALLGADPGLGPVVDVLIEQTGGNPLFLEECVRTLTETGALAGPRGPDGTVSLTSLQGLATVQAVLASRMRRLTPPDRRLLEVASVIGPKVAVPVLGAVAGLPEDQLRAGLGRLAAADFLYESGLFPGVEYTFAQPLMHEVAYEGLGAERRRALHATVLDALERLAPGRRTTQPDVLGDHAFRGGLWSKAVSYLRQAGARAVARAANEEAVARYDRALEALAQLPDAQEVREQAVDLRLELRPPLLQLGRLEDVLRVSRQAENLARLIGDEARLAAVYTYLANYHYLKGEPEAAIDYGQRCVAIGEARSDAGLTALARAYMGYSLHAQGRFREAETILARNVETLEPLRRGGTVQVVVAHVGSSAWLAFTMAELGEFELAERHVQTAIQAAEESRNPYSQAIAGTMAGLTWLARGHLERALPTLEASVAACREKHLVVWEPVPLSLLGVALARAARAAEGLPLLREGVGRTERLGVNAYLALWRTHLAEGLLGAGEPARAHAEAEEALRLAIAHKERGHQAHALRLMGEIALAGARPDLARAGRDLDQALALAEELEMRPLVARCHLALGGLRWHAGQRQQALDHVFTATTLCRAMDLRLWLDQAVARLKRLGRIFVVARDNVGFYEFLRERMGGDDSVRVVLDRRQVAARRPPELAADRRRPPQDGALYSKGVLVIPVPSGPLDLINP
jgi:tetratricopeptide (TPR) repeat protein